MYRSWATVQTLSLFCSKQALQQEVLIAPKWISLPDLQGSAAIAW
jgi:hypothetical protein